MVETEQVANMSWMQRAVIDQFSCAHAIAEPMRKNRGTVYDSFRTVSRSSL